MPGTDGAPCTLRAAEDGEEKATRGCGNGGGGGVSQSCFCKAHARWVGGSCPPVQSPWDGVREAQTLTVVLIILPTPLPVQDRGPQQQEASCNGRKVLSLPCPCPLRPRSHFPVGFFFLFLVFSNASVCILTSHPYLSQG